MRHSRPDQNGAAVDTAVAAADVVVVVVVVVAAAAAAIWCLANENCTKLS